MPATIDYTQFNPHDMSAVKRRTQGLYTGPASYPTGGDPLVPGDVSLGVIDVMDFTPGSDTPPTTIYTVVYDYANNKALWFVGTTGLQVANGVNLSAITTRFEAIGR